MLKRVVSPSYFETLGIQMIAGRPLVSFDGREGALQGIVVNETFVKMAKLSNPVGQRIPFDYGDLDQPTFLNLCAAGKTDLPPHDLLRFIKQLEQAIGRTPTRRWGQTARLASWSVLSAK